MDIFDGWLLKADKKKSEAAPIVSSPKEHHMSKTLHHEMKPLEEANHDDSSGYFDSCFSAPYS
jgi:hypothetical protein